MKRASVFISLMVLTIIFTISATAQKSDFSGIWKLDRQKSQVSGNTPFLVKISVTLKADSLLTVRTYDVGDGQEYPFTENLSVDNKESSITIYEMPRKARARWSEPDNTVDLESTITFNGSGGPEDFASKETWKIDKENNTLTISFINKSSAGESSGHFFLTREVQ